MGKIIGPEVKLLKYKKISKLIKISKKYNIEFNQKNIPELGFISVLSDLLNKAMLKKPRIFNSLKNKKEIVIVDIGCGYFRYGRAMHLVFSKINNNVKIFAVDKDKHMINYDNAVFIKGDVNHICNEIKKRGIAKVDIITVFNPFPGIPDFSNLKKDIGKESILFGCIDWNPDLFKTSLSNNKYVPLIWQKNNHWDEMRPWWNNYNPFVFAINKKKAKTPTISFDFSSL